jgi:hypothetical protein
MSFILYTWKKYLADWGDDLLKSLADFTNNWLIRLKNRANAEKEREHLTPLRPPPPPPLLQQQSYYDTIINLLLRGFLF